MLGRKTTFDTIKVHDLFLLVVAGPKWAETMMPPPPWWIDYDTNVTLDDSSYKKEVYSSSID